MRDTQGWSGHGRRTRAATWSAGVAAAMLAVALSGAPPTQAAPGAVPRAAVQHLRAEGDAVLVGAGDIAVCNGIADSATAALVAATAGSVFTLGDNAYPDGTAVDFANCYGPTWGAFKDRTRPVAGNHDYVTPGAAAYFAYFGAAAGAPGQGWYSYDVGTDWHVVVLNSNCAFVGGCEEGSPQVQWLQADLAASKRACTVAMWHHPRFSSTYPGGIPPTSIPSTRAFWKALYDDGTEVVLNAHEHVYERFAAQDASGTADPTKGIRQFTVGTGGEELSAFHKIAANSQARSSASFGVLRLTLGRGTYAWNFLPVAGSTYTDSGTGSCTGGGLSPSAPPPPGTPPGTPAPAAETCQGRVATQVGARRKVVGTPGDDVIVSAKARKVLAGGGNDVVCVTSSRGVTVVGGAGHDVVKGGRGDDELAGNGGEDVLRGSGGDDRLVGGGGKDRLLGGGGRDAASGGAGRDRCKAERERTCER